MLDINEVRKFLRALPVASNLFKKKDVLPIFNEDELRHDLKIIERKLEIFQGFLFKQKPEYDEQKIVYHGWIKAFPEQRGLLEALGAIVMEHNKPLNYFGCICGKAAMEALVLGFPTFWPGCFTACIGDEQLPLKLQEYWLYPNVLVMDDDVVDGKWKCPRCGAVMKIERRRCGNCMAYRTYLKTDWP